MARAVSAKPAVPASGMKCGPLSLLLLSVWTSAQAQAPLAPASAADDRSAPLQTRTPQVKARDHPVEPVIVHWPSYIPNESASAYVIRTTLLDPVCPAFLRTIPPTVEAAGILQVPVCARVQADDRGAKSDSAPNHSDSIGRASANAPFFDATANRDRGAAYDGALKHLRTRLLAVPNVEDLPYSTYLSAVTVRLDDCSDKAFHLKAGGIGVCQDFATTLETEDVAAFVVAHELGHAYLGHVHAEQDALRRKVNTSTTAARATVAGAVTGGAILTTAGLAYYVTRSEEIRDRRSADGRLLGRDRKSQFEQFKDDARDVFTTGSGFLTFAAAVAATQYTVRNAPEAWAKVKSVRIDLDYADARDDNEKDADRFAVDLVLAAAYNRDAPEFLLQQMNDDTADAFAAAASPGHLGFGEADRPHWGRDATDKSRIEFVTSIVGAYPESALNQQAETPLNFEGLEADADVVRAAVMRSRLARRDLAIALATGDSAARTTSASCAAARQTAADLTKQFPNNAVFVRLALATDVICGETPVDVGVISARDWGEVSDMTVKLDTIWRGRAQSTDESPQIRALERALIADASGDLFAQMRVQVNLAEYGSSGLDVTTACEARLAKVNVAIVDRLPGPLQYFVDAWNLLENSFFSTDAPLQSLCDGERGVTKSLADAERATLRRGRSLAVKYDLPADAAGLSFVREALDQAERAKATPHL